MNLKDKFTIFHTKLNLIGGLIAADNIPTACVEIGALKQFALQLIGELEDEHPANATEEFAQGIKERKEILDRLEKLGKLFNAH